MGKNSEDLATDYLVGHGYQILDRNIVFHKFELDIIAFDPKFQELVFVEVKSRRTGQYGDPSQAVNQHKLKNMKTVAQIYQTKHNYRGDYRFDIVSVLANHQVKHYTNVSWYMR